MNLDDLLVQIQDMQQRLAQMLSTDRATPSQQQQLESIATSFQELCTAKVEPQVINEKLNSSSSDRFQLFATALDCIIYEWDIENRTVERTQGLFDVLGYRPDEVEPTLSWWTQRIHSGDRERARNAVKNALTNSSKFDTEYRVLHKDKRYRYVRDKGLIIRNAEGKVVCVLGITIDITECKQVEEALKETTQRLQTAITNAPIILFALDSEGVFTLSEGRALESLGKKPNQSVGQSVFDLYRDNPNILDNMRRTLAGVEGTWIGEVGDLVYENRTTPLRDENGQVIGLIGVATDITERKRAEDALRESEQRLQAILDNSPIAVYIKDRQGRYLLVNRQCERIQRRSKEQIIGRTDYDAFPRAIADQYTANDQEVLATQTPLVREEEMQLEDGLHTVISVKFPLFDTKGVPYAVCGISTDITERKRAEQALQRLNEELENRVRQRTESLQQLNEQLQNEIAERQQTLNALRLSEERFRQLAENIHQVFWVKSSDHSQLLYISPAYEQIWGRTCASLYEQPKSWMDAIHPDDRDRTTTILRNRSREARQGEYRIVRPDGSIRWIQFQTFPVRDEAGQVYRFVGIAEDISDRKQADSEAARSAEALRRREQEFKALVENAPDVIARLDRQLRHLYVNPAIEKETGISPEAFIGKTFQELEIPSELAAFWSQEISGVFETGVEREIEFSYSTPNGLRYHLSRLVPEFSVDGSTETVLTIGRDITQRKQAEEALRESEERFRQLAENIREVFWMVSLDRTQVIYISPAYEEIWGRTCERLYREPLSWLEAIHPDDRDRMAAAPEQYKNGNYDLEYRIVRPDGTVRWIRDRSFPIKDFTGQVYRITGIAEDITLAKQALLDLQESEEHLRLVVQNMPVMMDAFDADGSIIVWNRECERVTGYSASEIVGNPRLFEILYPDTDYREQMMAQWRERGHDYRDWEWKLTCKDGRVKTIAWFNISECFPIPGWEWWAIGVDVTERKIAEEALRESEQLFRQLTENIREVFWMTTPDHAQIIYVSPAYEEIWGRTCESLYEEQNSWLEAICSEDRDRVIAAFDKLWVGEYNVEYRIITPDGTVRWIRDRGFPVRDEQGRAYRLAGIAEDITQQKLIEAELEKVIQRERELNELRSRFISMTSHEFRNPLTTISTSAQLLERYGNKFSQENQRSYLHRIQAAVKQMIQLLDDVLLIGKAEADRMKCNPTPIDLLQFCRDLVEQLQLADKNQHNVAFTHQGDCTKAAQGTSEGESREFDQSLPLLDEKLLQHILGNLLSNAIKYSPSGSTVRFDLTCLSDQAIFQIQDQGIGIPPEDLPRLFEAFHRANNVGKIKGTGLGLAIVKQCVDLHGGQISAESVVGSGTTFTVTLPLDYSEFISP